MALQVAMRKAHKASCWWLARDTKKVLLGRGDPTLWWAALGLFFRQQQVTLCPVAVTLWLPRCAVPVPWKDHLYWAAPGVAQFSPLFEVKATAVPQ